MRLPKLDEIDWKIWKPRLAYGAFTAFAFLLALRWTFPAVEVKERLIFEAGARGWQIDMETSRRDFLSVYAEASSRASWTRDPQARSRRFAAHPPAHRAAVDLVRRAPSRGRVGGADLSGDERRLVAEVEDVDLGRALPLRKASGMDLRGILAGTADVTIPEAANKRSTGRVEATVSDAGVGGGQLPIAAMSGSLTLPAMSLGQLTAALKIADGKATFEKFETTGGDAELKTDGLYFVSSRGWSSRRSRKANKIAEAFWQGGTQMFGARRDGAGSRGRDGRSTLSRIVGHPRMRPAAAVICSDPRCAAAIRQTLNRPTRPRGPARAPGVQNPVSLDCRLVRRPSATG
jgi:type II secretion system protein N